MSLQSLDDLAHAIDIASDAGDETSLRRLGDVCEDRLRAAEGIDRVRLLYYRSNTFSSIIAIKGNDPEYIWNWNQPEGVENILLLRRAISEPSFADTNSVLAHQIRTNLANRLHAIGRPIAANEERLRVLRRDPLFAKALAGQARGIAFYATQVYDNGHIPLLLAAAQSLFDAALDKTAFWESDDRSLIAPTLQEERNRISDDLRRMAMTKVTTLTDGLWVILKMRRPIAAGACASVYSLILSTTHTHRASPQQMCCTFQVTLTESMNLHVSRPISIC